MTDPLKKILEPIKELQNIRGVHLPIGLEFLQLVVTGPPGAGKSYYIEQIKGWPNEGYLDLTKKNWWKNQSLIYRPREVHLGLPFHGIQEGLTVFDKDWLNCDPKPQIEFSRIQLPPSYTHSLQTDWVNRYIFEFLIPGPSTIYQQRLDRQSQGYFPVDDNLDLQMVKQQVAVYREVALYLHRAGLNVYIRKGLNKPPMRIAEKGVANIPRWALDRQRKKPSLKSLVGWKYLFRRKYPIKWVTLSHDMQSLEQECRVAHDGKSFDLFLADSKLRFQPEIAIGVKRRATQKNWIINTEFGCSTKSIQGFARIRVGENVVIGKANLEYDELFTFSDAVAKRHVSITNKKGDLVITPLDTDRDLHIVRLDDLDYRERIERGRYKALLDIRNLYGQKVTPLSAAIALETIQSVNELLQKEPFRPLDSSGTPGGLIELPKATTPIIIGDLHAQVNNLLKILSENCLLDCLRMKTATLILLGDAIHSENANELDKFESSMVMMDLIFQLKLRFPANVFYIRGNHDSFEPEINKGNVLQGALFKETLISERGEEYAQEMLTFYNSLPYIVFTESFLACHAGPPRTATSRKQLINISQNPKLARQLVNNRLQRPNNLGGYTKGDVKKFRKGLGLPQKTRFMVGHTPLDPFGSFWLHAGAIKNHHIIYSAHNDGPSIIIQTRDGFMPISYPAEPLTDIINSLK